MLSPDDNRLRRAVRHPELYISSEHGMPCFRFHLLAHPPREVTTCRVGAKVLISEHDVVVEVHHHGPSDVLRCAMGKVPRAGREKGNRPASVSIG